MISNRAIDPGVCQIPRLSHIPPASPEGGGTVARLIFRLVPGLSRLLSRQTVRGGVMRYLMSPRALRGPLPGQSARLTLGRLL